MANILRTVDDDLLLPEEILDKEATFDPTLAVFQNDVSLVFRREKARRNVGVHALTMHFT